MIQSNSHKYLAAISPYSNIFKQPRIPASSTITGAVYLFRHGILEVSHHDYNAHIVPFLKKLQALQEQRKPFVRGSLAFLGTYRSWITAAHVGTVSKAGLQQSHDLGTAFRIRYRQWLASPSKGSKVVPTLSVWTDEAARCHQSAVAFADAFSGKSNKAPRSCESSLRQVDTKVKVLAVDKDDKSCENLCWHNAFHVDQEAGSEQMKQLMSLTTSASLSRLENDWLGPTATPLTGQDIYCMQLLHCYDIVSGRKSHFDHCFDAEDWAGFEYLRDTKYHFSEGYGAKNGGIYSVPWMDAAMRVLFRISRQKGASLPLRVGFTHREEVLYLCCLLGICYEKDWQPSLKRVDANRQWRVSLLAPYLGHVGIETYVGNSKQERLRIIVNGEVRPAFFGHVEQDEDGGYDMNEVNTWTQRRLQEWEHIEGGILQFLDEE